MINDDGKLVDVYVPKKCSATNKVIGAKDHASVQISVAKLDKNGVATGQYETVVFSGNLRSHGQVDAALNKLMIEKKILKNV